MVLAGCGGEADDKPQAGEAPGGAAPAMAMPPAMVALGAVQQQTLQDRWEVVGRLVEVQRALVAAEVGGKVIAIDVDDGDAVIVDQTVLAEIDGVWAKLNLEAAEAGVRSAEALVDRVQLDLTFLEELAESGSAKPKEVGDARAIVAAQEAKLQEAVAQRNRAAEQVARLQVKAPFDGVVVAKLVEVGQWVNPGTPVAEIVSRGKIDAVIDVPEDLVNHVSIDQPMDVHVEPLNEDVQGVVRAIVPDGGNAARTFPVKISLDDQDGRLKAGMGVRVDVPTTRQIEVLTVPRDAVLQTPMGSAVWVSMQGAAVQVPVDVLFGSADRLAVRTAERHMGPPLADGMAVVVEGGQRIAFPGQPLMPLPPPGAAPAPMAADGDDRSPQDATTTE